MLSGRCPCVATPWLSNVRAMFPGAHAPGYSIPRLRGYRPNLGLDREPACCARYPSVPVRPYGYTWNRTSQKTCWLDECRQFSRIPIPDSADEPH